jgi:serine protease Do
MFAVAASNLTRPTSASAQAVPTRKPMSGESKAVLYAIQDAFVNIADTVEPSVVTITARSSQAERTSNEQAPDTSPRDGVDPFDFFRRLPRPDGPERGTSTGSGVIIREQGDTVWVLTNNHVVDGRDKYRVQLFDHAEYAADKVGIDERSDLAVIKFRTRRPLPAGSVARLGNSDDVKTGQWALAIGSPLGYESTLTVGVISAKGRELAGLGRGAANYTDLIQTDASINPGNSGGALVNIEGEVIGINVAIASSGMSQGNIGIGFAIPANTARMVSEQLIGHGKVVRGFLGVQCSQSNRELAESLRQTLHVPQGGALAESVTPDTPAARAGMKDGDVIVKFGTRDVHNFTDLEKAVSNVNPGSAIPVEVIREGRPVRLEVTVMERPSEQDLLKRFSQGDGPGGGKEPATPQSTHSKFGLSVRAADEGKGAQIAAVANGSVAAEAGLRSGYVVTQVDETPTPSVDAFQKAINAAAGNNEIVLRVKTPEGLRFVVLKP